ncbi:MAG: radical SAM/SPASM domain-containing protein [Candidatus Binatia bacterium]
MGFQGGLKLQRLLDRYVSPPLSRIFWKFQLAQDEFPGIIGLEVTSICNLKCPMCPRTFSSRKFGHMSLSLFRRLIDEIAPYDARGMVEQVALQGYGEIFLHPNWFEIVEYANQKIKKAHIRLDTNGTLMRPPVIERLFQSHQRTLIISVDAVDEESYEFLRAGGKFQQTVENVRHFIEIRRKEPDRGPTVSIQVIESDYTRCYLPEFKAFWQEQIKDAPRIYISVISFHNFAGQIANGLFQKTTNKGLHVNLPCYRLTYEADIFSDGVTSVCCVDSERQIVIGNADRQSIWEMWHGPQARHYRESMRKAQYGPLPLCQTCPHSQKFLKSYTDATRFRQAVSYLMQMRQRFVRKRLMAES